VLEQENKPNDVVQQLKTELEETQERVEALGAAVESFVKLNGSGDGVRRRLRRSLKTSKFIKACESIAKR
jgi:hypothetical protein